MTASKDAAELRSVDSGEVIKGVVALLFTPFTDDGTRFDAASMRRQLDFVLESGVSSVVACGKAGEFEGQTLEEIEEVLTTVLEHVNGRVPVGMGIISVEEDRGLSAAELAARCGADFAMTKKLTRAGLHGFFSRIAERIPVMLYDQTNEGTLDVDGEVLPLVAAIEGIMTVKVSGNVYSFDRLKGAAPQAAYICGWDAFSLGIRRRRRGCRQRRGHADREVELQCRPAPGTTPGSHAHDRLLHPGPPPSRCASTSCTGRACLIHRWFGRPTQTPRLGQQRAGAAARVEGAEPPGCRVSRIDLASAPTGHCSGTRR